MVHLEREIFANCEMSLASLFEKDLNVPALVAANASISPNVFPTYVARHGRIPKTKHAAFAALREIFIRDPEVHATDELKQECKQQLEIILQKVRALQTQLYVQTDHACVCRQ